MKRITKDQIIYSLSKDHAPVASISSGETVLFETCDCFTDTINSEKTLMEDLDFERVNPATGPVFIEGAQPGDVLQVDILEIQVNDRGVMIVAEGEGLLGEFVKEARTRIFPVDATEIEMFGLRLPLTKMIGVIGVAPADEDVPTGTPDEHGGNMDCTLIREGSSLFLPVQVEGGLLAMGDLHALMGDGEISVTGVEASGTVRVKITLLKNSSLPTPSILTEELFTTLFSAETMEEASKGASKKMIDYLTQETTLDFNEAYMLLSAVGKLAVCQVVDPLITMRMELQRKILDQLMKK